VFNLRVRLALGNLLDRKASRLEAPAHLLRRVQIEFIVTGALHSSTESIVWPQALFENRLAERAGARYAGCVEPLPYSDERDAATGSLNARAIADWSPRLADPIGRVLDAGEFPLVLGGDCSILLGAMLALKRRGRFALLFIDGHADFYQPAANPNGEAASMDLAFATAYGPALLTDLEGVMPLRS
jgi:arginase